MTVHTSREEIFFDYVNYSKFVDGTLISARQMQLQGYDAKLKKSVVIILYKKKLKKRFIWSEAEGLYVPSKISFLSFLCLREFFLRCPYVLALLKCFLFLFKFLGIINSKSSSAFFFSHCLRVFLLFIIEFPCFKFLFFSSFVYSRFSHSHLSWLLHPF